MKDYFIENQKKRPVPGLDSIRTVGKPIKKSFFFEISFLLANLPEILSPLLELLQI